jgi:hypothetical protein
MPRGFRVCQVLSERSLANRQKCWSSSGFVNTKAPSGVPALAEKTVLREMIHLSMLASTAFETCVPHPSLSSCLRVLLCFR